MGNKCFFHMGNQYEDSAHQHDNKADKVIGRDDNSVNNITIGTIIQQIGRTIQESDEIPEKEKPGLLSSINKLLKHPIVEKLSATAIVELIKGAVLIP